MSTVTASATDQDLVANVTGVSYGPLIPPDQGSGSYVVAWRAAFELALAKSETGWTIEDRPTGVHGFGETPSDALADFRAAAAEHLDVLERQDALSEGLRLQLDYLRARLTA